MTRRLELPTLIVGVSVYATWCALTFFFHRLPLALVIPMAAFVVAWQSSLQHECVHGHPSSSSRFNAFFAGFSLWLYLPFTLYRETHLAHHESEHLTSPLLDTESYYFTASQWRVFGPLRRAFWVAHNSLLGRFVLGPPVVLFRVAQSELALLGKGDLSHLRHWALHALFVAAILWWTSTVCGLALWEYLLFFVYPGMSLSLLRSFAEHKPADSQDKRCAIVEANPIFRLLFLGNNFHLLHHKNPGLPWYRMNAHYQRERVNLLRDNDALVYSGYGEIARRFLFHPAASPMHPRVQK